MKNDSEKKPPDTDDGEMNEEEGGGSALPLGMCFGSAMGLLGMVLTGEIFWLTIGVGAGVMLGLAWGQWNKHDKEDK